MGEEPGAAGPPAFRRGPDRDRDHGAADLVALQITSNSSLPEVDYLILLDKIYIASYTFVVLTMVMIVRNSWVEAEGDVAVAKQVDRRSLLWLKGAYVIVVASIFIQSLA